MIIKGASRSGPGGLADHLGNAATNERVTLLETRGTVARDLRGALIELDAYAVGTRCEKPLYHANIDPQPPYRLTPQQRAEAIDALEEKLGLIGHQRVVVMHEKHGREHVHVVWTRIDIDRMKSVSDSHNYRKHEEVARDLERRFGHERVQGAHAERDGVDRPDRSPSRSELRQEERTGISGRQVKLEVSAAFKASDGPVAFRAAIEERGYILARGDRRDFVIVDRAGGIHSLARRLDKLNAAQLREFMAPLDRQGIPSVAKAQEITDERLRKLAHAEQTGNESKLESSFSHGADYVTQSRAALREHRRRQAALDSQFKASAPKNEAKPEVTDAAIERAGKLLDSANEQIQTPDQSDAGRDQDDPGHDPTFSR